MQMVLPLLVFLFCFSLTMAVYLLFADRQRLRKQRLLDRLAAETADSGQNRPAVRAARIRGPLERRLSQWVDLAPLARLLQSAGQPLSMDRFLAACLALGGVLAIVVLCLLSSPAAAVLAMALGMVLPPAWLHVKCRRRQELLVRQLPEAIDMITRAIRAGQSVDGALREVGRSMPAPVGVEIRTIYSEIAMGFPFDVAVRNFEKRFPAIPDVKILCAAFVLQKETGGNLSAILGNLSTTIRERFKLMLQIRAITAEGRVTIVILGLIPVVFSMITWLVNPEYIRVLFVHPAGKLLLLLAIFLELAGFVIMRQLIRIRV
ncbi:type II secretion system F family protein [uncultured Desulfosarcina sp.]|uniref:type II secretion system F family protein n=1 Tax=uncultured Desulfosarcina sp. TaxID=218289 RepID=UPI0029C72492|nr:type II secretion system F family protein [uncultured Desulfosarcina sp.]